LRNSVVESVLTVWAKGAKAEATNIYAQVGIRASAEQMILTCLS